MIAHAPALALALLGCTGSLPAGKYEAAPGTGGGIDTGRTLDPGPIDDTGDSGPIDDSAADSAACIPSQPEPCIPDTGVCDGCPAGGTARACDEPIPWAPPVDGNERFDRSNVVDCAVSATTARGDRHFDCADAFLAWPYLLGGEEGALVFGADWLGDLDNDGLTDLSFQRSTAYWKADNSLSTALVYAGRRLRSGDLASETDAVGMLDLVPATGAGDVDGDGLDDFLLLLGLGDNDIRGIGLTSGRSRDEGAELRWAEPDVYWTFEEYRGAGTLGLGPFHVGMADTGDVTGDRTADLLFSDWNRDTALSQVYLLAGGPELLRGGSAWDAAAWRFLEHWPEGAPDVGVLARVVGDLDGDGVDEIGLIDAPEDWPAGGRGWRFGTASLSVLPPCDYAVSDVIGTALAVPDAAPTGTNLGFRPDDGQAFALARGGDVNGDGADDVVVGGSVADGDGGQPVLWILYGGETWLAAGGNLSGNADRIEFPFVPADTTLRAPTFEQIARIDLDANGIDDIVVGGMLTEGFGRAAWATIIPGLSGGLRGVHACDDPAFPVILADDDYYVVPARHSGDLDDDGFEDLVLTAISVYDDDPLSVGIFYGGAFP